MVPSDRGLAAACGLSLGRSATAASLRWPRRAPPDYRPPVLGAPDAPAHGGPRGGARRLAEAPPDRGHELALLVRLILLPRGQQPLLRPDLVGQLEHVEVAELARGNQRHRH